MGCGAGNFCPEDTVSRAAAAVFLVRAYALPVLTPLVDIKRETPVDGVGPLYAPPYVRFKWRAILVERGATITWTNTDSQQTHNVHISLGDIQSGPLSNGQSFQWDVPLDAPLGQSFSYYCSLHPAEVGYIQPYGVNGVSLEAIAGESGPIEDNPGNGTPGTKIGLRTLPDAPAPGQAARDRVGVVAALNPPARPYMRLYLRVMDVDDPSSDDPADDHDGPGGIDNRGGIGFLQPGGGQLPTQVEVQTDGDGKGRATLVLPLYPGDNLRVAACADAAYLSGLTASGTNLVDSQGRTLPTGRAEVSPLLTIWRYLHIERDSMAAVQSNTVSGWIPENGVTVVDQPAQNTPGRTDISVEPYLDPSPRYVGGSLTWAAGRAQVRGNSSTAVWIPSSDPSPPVGTVAALADGPQGWIVAVATGNVTPGPGADEKTITVAVALDDYPPGSAGRFQSGTLTTSGRTYEVISNSDRVVRVRVQYGQQQPVHKQTFTIRDDDDNSLLPRSLDAADVAAIAQAFKEVYIETLDDAAAAAGGINQTNSRFVLNLKGDATEPLNAQVSHANSRQSGAESDSFYWVSYVQTSHQDIREKDWDPPVGEGAGGVSVEVAPEGRFIHCETIRDACGGLQPVDIRYVAIHEMGHDFGIIEHRGGVMEPLTCGRTPSPYFTPRNRDIIRHAAYP
jgi:hypothetical protein